MVWGGVKDLARGKKWGYLYLRAFGNIACIATHKMAIINKAYAQVKEMRKKMTPCLLRLRGRGAIVYGGLMRLMRLMLHFVLGINKDKELEILPFYSP